MPYARRFLQAAQAENCFRRMPEPACAASFFKKLWKIGREIRSYMENRLQKTAMPCKKTACVLHEEKPSAEFRPPKRAK